MSFTRAQFTVSDTVEPVRTSTTSSGAKTAAAGLTESPVSNKAAADPTATAILERDLTLVKPNLLFLKVSTPFQRRYLAHNSTVSERFK
jgi:hypothetical protein